MRTILRRTFTWKEWVGKVEHSPRSSVEGSQWSGGTLKEALQMAKTDGYQAVVADAERLAEGLSDTVQSLINTETFTFHQDVVGSQVDVAAYLEGIPECMVYAKPIQIAKAGRAVRIVVPVNYSSNINTDTVKRRGAAVMALVYILQNLQHPLEVWGSAANANDRYRRSYLIEVQRADDPVDIGRVMYALCHPTMLRVCKFRVEDHETGNEASMNRGNPVPCQDDDLDEQAGTTIVMPVLTSNYGWDTDGCVKWITEQLHVIFGDERD